VARYSSPPVLGGATAAFTEVRWSSGTTEGGSSGSGLFTYDGSRYVLRGALWGGAASCTNTGGPDNYSRLDQVYSSLAPFLDPPVTAAVDYTDLWWNPAESGWGLNLIQHASRNIFGVWYTYGDSGKRTWYVLPGGTWVDSNTFTGTLYATTGPASDAAKFDAQRTKATSVGTATLRFSDANNGTWSYSVGGLSGTKPIARQSY
jgi:lysyl endopeptidase